ncbi:ferredoxin family protein [Sphingomonas sp. AOB5]|uniref:ferredoxin FdxA n=1 Tax=Sphingomonas sp. AOB5 TaxID=3034017 RepID=UPI0023F78296|nr:ferredoxin FdxA [Sphingomonas sp. AOB5]MDF7777850.1 ferredoxin family protein [Sphingomonas sp. AOB5]
MAYVVTDACIRCKYMDCVSVCPADCFYEGDNMLVIHPDECIDCGVCEAECPAEAILPADDADQKWQDLNAEYSQVWPNVTTKRDAPADADGFKGEAGKFEKYFSTAPGTGG